MAYYDIRQVLKLSEREIQIFKSCGFNSTVKTNLKTVGFLDVRLDLINYTYQPYRKPNSETVYINKHSNHPPSILKELPKAINKRITDISCNQDIFDAAKSTYEQALSKSHFNENKNIITKIERGKLGIKKRGREEGRLYGLIHPFL